MTTTMTKGERDELRRIVRQRFKVLRSEVTQRQRELTAGIDGQIVNRHRDRDEKRQEVADDIARICADAQREVREVLKAVDIGELGPYQGTRIQWFPPTWGDDGRHELRRAALSDLDAKVKAATLRLDREEVDLLQSLAIGALESAEAHEFLKRIPTVGELVPAARLEELEAALDPSEVG
jgi:hypothetical protein